MLTRRRFLAAMAGGLGLGGTMLWPDEGILNPCLGQLPSSLANHDMVLAAWEGIDPGLAWDSHLHLIGVGDGGTGIRMDSDMEDPLHPVSYLQRAFYLNASCANDEGRVDTAFIERLLALHDDMPPGYKSMLLAFDDCYDEHGRKRADLSAFFTPNRYAQSVAQRFPERLEWIASVHPYREDCVDALQSAVAAGARAVKWLPPAQGMDPASPLCDRFYEAMARLDLPLLSHAGTEQAVHGAQRPEYGNPLRLRRAMDHGVRVIVAHCASTGSYPDLDAGDKTERSAFELFARLMDQPGYEGLLFADISAITQRNRAGRPLQTVLERDDWHPRLINGSDYPLPGVMPLFSLKQLVTLGYLDETDAPVLSAIRRHNPLLFDFVLKRRLRWQGKQIARSVFESRRLFRSQKSA